VRKNPRRKKPPTECGVGGFFLCQTNGNLVTVHRDWRAEDGVSAIIATQEAARNDYNLSPSRYVASDDVEPPLSP